MMMDWNTQHRGPVDLRSFARRKPASMEKWLSRTSRRRDFDDDDPPPCPAAAGIPKRRPPIDALAGLTEHFSLAA